MSKGTNRIPIKEGLLKRMTPKGLYIRKRNAREVIGKANQYKRMTKRIYMLF